MIPVSAELVTGDVVFMIFVRRGSKIVEVPVIKYRELGVQPLSEHIRLQCPLMQVQRF